MPDPRTPRRQDLEALRGLAVLLVVAYHGGVPWLAGGFVGVDVFFVLSGFFTAQLLVREYAASGTVDVFTFYGRRALRLLPALLVVVVATLAGARMLLAPIDLPAVVSTARAAVLGVSNIAFARQSVDYFGGADSPFLHTWTLSIELQVALFAPLLFAGLAWVGSTRARGEDRRVSALLRGVGVGLLALFVVSFAIALWRTREAPVWAFFGTASRLWEFAAGGLLALLLPLEPTPVERARESGWMQLVGIAVLLGASLLFRGSMPWPGLGALVPVLATALVISGGATSRGLLAREGGPFDALRWFARLSYSWYLWHWPVLVLAAAVQPSLGLAARLAWALASLLPAWLTWKFVEEPVRARASAGAEERARFVMLAVGGAIAIALFVPPVRRSAEARIARSGQRVFAAAREDRVSHECWADRGVTRARLEPRCAFGDASATTVVALFGDSHAEHWLAALDRLGRERHWRVIPFVKGGCPVAAPPELAQGRYHKRGRECVEYRENALRQLIATRPALVVMSNWDEYVRREPIPDGPAAGWRGPVTAAKWRAALARSYSRVASAGIPVIVIRGTPQPGFDVPACLSRQAAGAVAAQRCSYDLGEALHAEARAAQLRAVQEVARTGRPVAAVDMTDVVCDRSPCPVVRQGLVAFTDDNHLTASFTRAAAPLLGARIDAALARMKKRLP